MIHQTLNLIPHGGINCRIPHISDVLQSLHSKCGSLSQTIVKKFACFQCIAPFLWKGAGLTLHTRHRCNVRTEGMQGYYKFQNLPSWATLEMDKPASEMIYFLVKPRDFCGCSWRVYWCMVYIHIYKNCIYIYIYIYMCVCVCVCVWCGDRIPVEAKFSAPVQTVPGAHPASCTMGTGSFPG